jgi:hypothetical protein
MKMYFIIGNPKTINALNGHFDINIGKLRSQTKICVIDDEIFPKKNMLMQHEFQIKEIGDIRDINAVQAYQIILCDIKGVGKAFGSDFEGGHIIEEINLYFPNKVIIAYTGERLDPTYNRFFQIADQSIKKDASDDQWRNVIDGTIKLVYSPIEQWKKTRRRLLELDISSKDLVKVEDLYVQSYLTRSDLISHNKTILGLKDDIKNILLHVAASFIYSAITGR